FNLLAQRFGQALAAPLSPANASSMAFSAVPIKDMFDSPVSDSAEQQRRFNEHSERLAWLRTSLDRQRDDIPMLELDRFVEIDALKRLLKAEPGRAQKLINWADTVHSISVMCEASPYVIYVLHALFIVLPTPLSAQTQPQPATLRSLLLHEFRTTHTKAEWFVPINTAVERPNGRQGQLAACQSRELSRATRLHLLFWNRRTLNNFQGLKNDHFTG
ncbi:MAG: hypothetical protein ACJ74Z_03650, partial [Bryobacteraceae bacterium]